MTSLFTPSTSLRGLRRQVEVEQFDFFHFIPHLELIKTDLCAFLSTEDRIVLIKGRRNEVFSIIFIYTCCICN